MKIVTFSRYKRTSALKIEIRSLPEPQKNEVRIKVKAASLNSWDWDRLQGKPPIFRLFLGVFRPRNVYLGCDIAGVVDSVGEDASRFAVGDRVYGDISGAGWKGFAEYVCVPESVLVPKPEGMTFEEAAAIPQAGLLAFQGLFKLARIQPGQSLLINGAGGGVGTFAIQMAINIGARVTCVDTDFKRRAVCNMGPVDFIDYTTEDFTASGRKYDVILDAMALRPLRHYRRALSSQGIFVFVGGHLGRMLLSLAQYPFIALTSAKRFKILAHQPNTDDLMTMNDLFESGKVTPVIDRCFPLDQIKEAFDHYASGQFVGKIVITMAQ